HAQGKDATMKYAPDITPSSGNVFADLGLDDADELLVKSELAWRIAEQIRASGMTQAQIAAELGIDQPRVSDLLRGRLRRFSLDRLLKLANAAGLDVTINLEPRADVGRPGRTRVGRPLASLPIGAPEGAARR
ncbi:MAG TPA: helix-turn-helix transcriptional regulator, partial [Thermomicrobiales bacterium]|nr:helix-turn-helix transcriptional regulator [Thermomicrobiales bacterium]